MNERVWRRCCSQRPELLLYRQALFEACRPLGIGLKTATRSWAENGGLQPNYLPEASRSGRCLSLLERRRVASLRGRGQAVREIAGPLGRAPSTVSRELRRNSRPH
ncbi:helix-turn-helix domain-containing protein [Streptomyces sp. V1I6]|uniref:helix-turn-helix domain-containing protein n=1 Tax=Streptomyces sp. V1I6 TaxID=3042273 RepID=UPI00359430C4